MTMVVLLGSLAGLGSIGVVLGLRPRPLSLESVAASAYRPIDSRPSASKPVIDRIGQSAVHLTGAELLISRPSWAALTRSLAVSGTSLDRLAAQVLVSGGLGFLAPPLIWLALEALGLSLPLGVLVLFALLVGVAMAVLPVAAMLQRAQERRRHFRVVVGSFVDLVVLELAGGMGIEGALFAASQISPDWAAQWMARSLLTARDSGTSPWSALGALGAEIGVTELVELSTTLQLAGTEGARIRQSLQARAASLRRHEQADEESAANAVTERLFVPGALLLVGFLVFVGYPAFTRILGGF